MLSYQHGFHAGNRADVLKHAILDAILTPLAKEGGNVLHVETHAGRGRYDLTGPQANKTGEAREGVASLLGLERPPRPLRPWLDRVRAAGLTAYPGSPDLAAQCLEDAGRLVLFERHPTEYEALRTTFAGDRRVQVKKGDGYGEALRLQPRRGETMTVFVDPSYETMQDMQDLAEWAPRALDRWPKAQLICWLPLFKDEREAEFGAFLADLEDGVVAGARWPAPSDRDTALAGSALVAYRVPQSVRDAATSIAASLQSLWNTGPSKPG